MKKSLFLKALLILVIGFTAYKLCDNKLKTVEGEIVDVKCGFLDAEKTKAATLVMLRGEGGFYYLGTRETNVDFKRGAIAIVAFDKSDTVIKTRVLLQTQKKGQPGSRVKEVKFKRIVSYEILRPGCSH